MAKEVDMVDAAEAPQEEAKVEEPASTAPSVSEQLAANVKLIEKAVRQKDTRLMFSKVLRQTQALRRQLTPGIVQAFLRSVLPEGSPSLPLLLQQVKKATAMDTSAVEDGASPPPAASAEPLPEVEIYAYLLVVLLLVDASQWADSRAVSAAAVERLAAFNRRTLDVLAARVYYYFSWSAEKCEALGEVRTTLLGLHRTAVLRHDDVGQETLLNLLLRNYLHYSLYDQAEALRAKAQHDIYRSAQQHCRLLYYQGRIRAVQLEYTDAKDALQQAVRKAPAAARGFRAAATKWLVLVRLLLGEVPDRAELAAPEVRTPLEPYLELAAAVRGGDLATFSAVAQQHAASFRADNTWHLVGRLRASVIRAGLRRVNLAYSRIPLAEVATKLGLASLEDAEQVVAKAIRDGQVAATLDHDARVMASAGGADIYSTDEPQAAFHARIAFCMDLHNDALRAMRYDTLSAAQREWDDATALRERQEQELQAALEEDDMMDF